ncbi:hypothetical protein CEK26_001785 [Fusarium fujikuroi]|nr:hypothetical protein CEK27_001783 [Fusarium fujikuroi]QGI76859.1 hypothetical protein CEK25_001765 [Fusarium fujikuroi]QGI90570.1 hypothetical protein CEK26_001785 [Fusarium fujikuroi]VTT72244.1 unnamed protein product [Fusarium fujikuroi]
MEGVDFELLLGNGSAQLVDLNLPVFSGSLIICSDLKWRHDEVNPGDEFGESPAATRATTLWFRLALIESERICKTCRPEFESRKRTGISLDCKFAARTDQDWIYCSACEVEYPTLCFSSEEIPKQSDRVYIARTGYVRICAHEVLTWDEMKAGLAFKPQDPSSLSQGGSKSTNRVGRKNQRLLLSDFIGWNPHKEL